MKSEGLVYSIHDLEADGTTWWEGVRNYEARNLMRDQLKVDDEVLFYIDQHELMGCGIGYIDAHLLAANALASPIKLWTLDRRLAGVAGELGMRK